MTRVEKNRTRSRSQAAKRNGTLVPTPCEDCGANEVEMHHEDYSDPLDVTWLCKPCHYARHGAIYTGEGPPPSEPSPTYLYRVYFDNAHDAIGVYAVNEKHAAMVASELKGWPADDLVIRYRKTVTAFVAKQSETKAA